MAGGGAEGARTGGPRVAFQGERGAFSEEAIIAVWRGRARPVPRRENLDVVRAVESGDADLGLLPLENSIAGTVTASYDALLASDSIRVGGECVLRIRHCLLGLEGAELSDIRTVESHPIALAQCRRFLERHPRIHPRAAYDTAGAAADVASGRDLSRAAIASRAAAAHYPLDVLAEGIEDRSDNQTRFVWFGTAPDEPVRGTPSRTLVVLGTPNRPGALFDVLRPLAELGINMSKLESRPAGEPWSYRFILEFEHDAGSDAADEALRRVRAAAASFRLLGTCPRAVGG